MMQEFQVQYTSGTIKEPQHTKSTEARWIDNTLTHSPDGRQTPIPAFVESSGASGSVTLRGTARSEWATYLQGASSITGAYYFTGTHSHLYAEFRTQRYNITPLADQKSEALGSNPLAVTSGNATMTVTWASHGLSVGDWVELESATDVGGVDADTYINIGHVVQSVTTNEFTVTLGTNASSTTSGGGSAISAFSIGVADTLGSNPITATNTSSVVSIAYTGHGLQADDRIMLQGATATGGITATELVGEFLVTAVTDADNFTVTTAGTATSDATGGGSVVRIYKQIAAGNENQGFFSGYSAGIYGSGTYGTDRSGGSVQTYPRIWSFGDFGNSVIMCPGDYTAGDGQKLYIWSGDLDVAPRVLDGYLFPNAPDNANWVTVIANQIVTTCEAQLIIATTDPTSGGATFPAVGSGSLLGDIIPVKRTSRLLSIATFDEKVAVVFAPRPMILRFSGGTWELLDEIGVDFPIVSPQAWCRFNDGVMWYAQDGNYYFFNGSGVQAIKNSMNGEWVRRNTNKNAEWTSFMLADQKHNQAWHYFPTGDSQNPDYYVIFNPADSSFTLSEQSRTSSQRPSVIENVFYMADGSTIYRSFTKETPDFAWSAQLAYFAFDNQNRYRLHQLEHDFYLDSDVDVTIYGREFYNGPETNWGTYTLSTSSNLITVKGAGKYVSLKFSGQGDAMLGGLKIYAARQGNRS